MKLLAFESSFDDMAVCLYRNGKIYHRTSRASNGRWGGGVPEINARHHLDTIKILTDEILKESNITIEEIDCFAGTIGPGLLPCLQIGYNMAKLLALNTNKCFIPVHHMEGHLLTCMYDITQYSEDIDEIILKHVQKLPMLVLLISGGHTMLVFVQSLFNYRVICDTLDDAVGEVFDKIARKIGLGFPGGAKLEQLALKSDCTIKFSVPIPKELSFSFSGIKTKLLNLINTNKHKQQYTDADLAAITQNTLTNILLHKTKLAMSYVKDKYKLNHINLGISGGVACNQHIRQVFKNNFSNCMFAPGYLCGDNAIMIAQAAICHHQSKTNIFNKISDIFPRMSLEKWSQLINKNS